jgi:glycosyltransferase involved in cell wall biosynthesis
VGATKISLITVTFNAGGTIEQCIRSVIGQNYENVEYIVIDGASTDNTIQIINQYRNHIHHFVSEADKGIYDAMNKGIKFATGDVVGMLNADDVFSNNNVLADIAAVFEDKSVRILYGDLDYVTEAGKIFRKWRTGRYTQGKYNWGWMPPHPTFYCRRELFDDYGLYGLDFGTAADYELMARLMHKYRINAYYLEKVIIDMKTGGTSNKNLGSRVKGLIGDLKAMSSSGIRAPFITVLLKRVRKIGQYL